MDVKELIEKLQGFYENKEASSKDVNDLKIDPKIEERKNKRIFVQTEWINKRLRGTAWYNIYRKQGFYYVYPFDQFGEKPYVLRLKELCELEEKIKQLNISKYLIHEIEF